jgi:hypothetical protein
LRFDHYLKNRLFKLNQLGDAIKEQQYHQFYLPQLSLHQKQDSMSVTARSNRGGFYSYREPSAMGSPDNRSLNSSRMMKVMDNQDKLYQQRQHKIISNIEKEEKMQKQREKAQKARKKERAEFFSKKQGAFEVCK